MNPHVLSVLFLVAFVGMVLAAFPGRSETLPPGLTLEVGADCAPEVAEAMNLASIAGLERDMAVIRSGDAGIQVPRRLSDFSCLERLLDFHRLDVHAPINGLVDGILGSVSNRVCQEAARLHAEFESHRVSPDFFLRGVIAPRSTREVR